MIELFNPCVHNIPKKRISEKDCMYLGYADNYCVWLVVEEGVLRIYHYEEWREDDIRENHEDEDWRAPVSDFFGASDSYLDLDSIAYVLPKFENMNNPVDMANEIILACDDLEDVSYSVQDDGLPTEKFVNFIKHCLDEIAEYKNGKVYLYYK